MTAEAASPATLVWSGGGAWKSTGAAEEEEEGGAAVVVALAAAASLVVEGAAIFPSSPMMGAGELPFGQSENARAAVLCGWSLARCDTLVLLPDRRLLCDVRSEVACGMEEEGEGKERAKVCGARSFQRNARSVRDGLMVAR